MSAPESEKEDGLTRLLAKQHEEIEALESKIETWTKYKNDYDDLKKVTSTIQDKVRYPHRIPIAGSQMAFVDGHIIHTNEINVLLGDNLFALRSAKQATQMIDRRLENINEMLKKTKDAKKKTEDWLKASEDHKREKEEFVEIIETI